MHTTLKASSHSPSTAASMLQTNCSSHERGGVGAGAGIICVLLVAGLVVPGLIHQDQRLRRRKG